MKYPLSKLFGYGIRVGVVGAYLAGSLAVSGTTTIVSEKSALQGQNARARYWGEYVMSGKPGELLYGSLTINLKLSPETGQKGWADCKIDGKQPWYQGGDYGYDYDFYLKDRFEGGSKHTFECEFEVRANDTKYRPEALLVGVTDPNGRNVAGGTAHIQVGGVNLTTQIGEWREVRVSDTATRWSGAITYADTVELRQARNSADLLEYACTEGNCSQVTYALNCTGGACGHLTTDAGGMDGSAKSLPVGGRIRVLPNGSPYPKGETKGEIQAVVTVP